jgi:hypothetical protein
VRISVKIRRHEAARKPAPVEQSPSVTRSALATVDGSREASRAAVGSFAACSPGSKFLGAPDDQSVLEAVRIGGRTPAGGFEVVEHDFLAALQEVGVTELCKTRYQGLDQCPDASSHPWIVVAGPDSVKPNSYRSQCVLIVGTGERHLVSASTMRSFVFGPKYLSQQPSTALGQ